VPYSLFASPAEASVALTKRGKVQMAMQMRRIEDMNHFECGRRTEGFRRVIVGRWRRRRRRRRRMMLQRGREIYIQKWG